MSTLKLLVMDRVLLTGVIDTAGKDGKSLSELSRLMKLSDRVSFTDEERKLLNLRNVRSLKLSSGEVVTSDAMDQFNMHIGKEGVEELPTSIAWNLRAGGTEDGELVDIERDIEISDEQAKLLCDIIKSLDEGKKFTKQGLASMLKIAEQVGYKVE